MRKIAYIRADGGVSVCTPIINVDEDITEAEAEQRAFDKLPATAINPVFVTDADIPQDYDFWEALEISDSGLNFSMAKAKNITKARLRTERAPLLLALDVAFLRNLETGACNAAVVAEKNRLRDITQTVDACSTLAELRALTCRRN